ncbi:VOC family protein [Gymnodinialimonas ceratoperidinii]|uniref:VOC family protein n=1 Tax=Gymnodinialimonas ceratoperidinii TaxID=2856823 RepID=A0A8F6TXX4_9RHOB|nr:VOC family protein [Gymnodinialimonas ceratoperidinii]QXT40740.1 VOC family protein [Gymnodinialimonas ceratoperidinii]
MLTFDHIAVSAETLARGVQDVETALGQPLLPGGEHPDMGTHNRLLSFGPEEYFEVIAVNPAAEGPDQPRWFNLDNFRGATRVTNWICRCPDIEAAIAAAPEGIGVPWKLQRGDLRWSMAIPEDGKLPFGGLFPALIQWHDDAHPAPRLRDTGVRLKELRLHAPEAAALRAALGPLMSDPRVSIIPAEAARIEAVLATPTGDVTL